MDPNAKQSELVTALEPVFDRVMRSYRTARESLLAARQRGDSEAEKGAQETIDALLHFRSDMGAYVRLYTFLSQIFDYGQTALEKLAIFYKRLIPLLEFDRERVGIDLSQVQLTHHALKKRSTDSLPLLPGLGDPLQPIKNSGAGLVREREKALMDELIERVNELFSGEKMLESRTLQQQARNNTKEQFGSSPDLMTTLNDAIIDAYDAHKTMSQQALNSKELQMGLLRILLDYGNLYDKLRARAV